MASTTSILAFSYLRFSDPSQEDGDSIRRQTALRDAWLARHPEAKLDESVTLADKGVSGFRGAHRTNPKNALAGFLDLVERGRIPKGSFLLIENMDRLSREKPVVGVNLITGLLLAGIRIVQLAPDEIELTEDSDLFALFRGQMSQARGHDESKTKSGRNGEAWGERRKKARNGEVLTRRLPAWVEERGGKLRLIPRRAAVVRRIFAMAEKGYGVFAIVKRLAEEDVPVFGTHLWNTSYVHSILKGRRALGEMQPLRHGEPDGEPIADYFPAVVSEETWLRARLGAQERHNRPGRVGERVNIFQGLIKGALDGEPYSVGSPSTNIPHAVLRSIAPQKGFGHKNSFPLGVFEDAVLSCLKEIDPHEILNGDSGPDESLVLAAELARVEAKIAELEAELVNGNVASLARVLRKLEDDKSDLAGKLAEARQKAAHPLSESWGECQSLAEALDKAPDPKDARLRLRSALRRIVDAIWLLVVPRGRVRLAAVQINFKGRNRRRTYLIYYKPAWGDARSRIEGRWWARSLADVAGPGKLDLRIRQQAKELEEVLSELDTDEIVE